jgi:hypothetical protein
MGTTGVIQTVFPVLRIKVLTSGQKGFVWLLGSSIAQRVLMDVNRMFARWKILEVEFDSKAVHTVVQDRCAYRLTPSILELNSIFRNRTRNQSNRRDCQSG